MGSMIYDADDMNRSQSWCSSNDSTLRAPMNVSCDYGPFTTTILIEVVSSLVSFAVTFLAVKFVLQDARLISSDAGERTPIKSATAPQPPGEI